MSEYSDRVIKHSLMWVNGKPTHNKIDDECVVDFSCCYPKMFTQDVSKRSQLHQQLIDKLRNYDRQMS